MTIGEHSLSPNNLLIKRALVEGDMIHNGTKILMGKIGVKPVKMEPLVVKVTSERRETPEHLENKGYLDLPDRKGRGDLPGPQDSKGQSD